MKTVIICILAINLFLSVLYAFIKIKKGEKFFEVLLFIMFPIGGFISYSLPFLLLRKGEKAKYDKDVLVRRLEIEEERSMPSVQKALNVIPIGDAMAISNNYEKRNLLLEQLKKDIDVNYKLVLPASNDSDSESAHYVAAAKMEVYRRKQASLISLKKELQEEPDSQEKWMNYMQELVEYIESALLAEKEADIYKREYCNHVQNAIRTGSFQLSSKQYSQCLTYYVELEEYKEIEELWEFLSDEMKDEQAYLSMLKFYYNSCNEAGFYRSLKELGASKITLSAEGLKLLRYWNERRPTE